MLFELSTTSHILSPSSYFLCQRKQKILLSLSPSKPFGFLKDAGGHTHVCQLCGLGEVA
jgi:hypothetical protein